MPQLVNERADVRVAGVSNRWRRRRQREFGIVFLSIRAGIHHGFRIPEIIRKELRDRYEIELIPRNYAVNK